MHSTQQIDSQSTYKAVFRVTACALLLLLSAAPLTHVGWHAQPLSPAGQSAPTCVK
jgi:hypothetical protein